MAPDISGVMVTTVANADSSGTWGLGVNWSPDPGPQTLCCVIGTNTRFVGGGGSVETITIRSDAGIPVTYFVQSTGNTKGTTYEVFFTVERLRIALSERSRWHSWREIAFTPATETEQDWW